MEGKVCHRCGREVTETEYSFGQTECCDAPVVSEEEFDTLDYFSVSNTKENAHIEDTEYPW